MSSYLSVYYTDYVHVTPGLVGTVMFVSKIFDAFSDVVMGTIQEKTAKPVRGSFAAAFHTPCPLF